jgi:peptidyl-prolyl cis-trans isomerase D
MLKKFRHKKIVKKIWITLLILILPGFVLWGLGGALRGQKNEYKYAGEIFGKKITLLEYRDAVDAVKNLMIMQFGYNLSDVEKHLNLESQAWERILLLYEAKQRRIKVNDQEVVDAIQSFPLFQRKGQFDDGIYSEILRYAFHTQARIFEEQMRQNLMLAKLYARITDKLALTNEEVTEEYRKYNEELSIYYIAGLLSDFQKDILPSEQEMKDYFAKNSLEFKRPLSFNLEYASVESEDKIKNIASRLKKKEDFSKIAKELAFEIKETGLFGQMDSIPGIGWSPEILTLIARLKVGDFSSPVQADKNYYILRLKERKEPFVPDFETVKEKVKQAVTKNMAREIAKNKMEDCLKKLKGLSLGSPKRVDFDKIAAEYGLRSGSTDSFKYGSYVTGLGASDNFWKVANGLKENEVSGIIETPLGFYIIKLKSRVPLDSKKFEAEKTEFSQKFLSQKKQEFFSKFVEELKTKARMF